MLRSPHDPGPREPDDVPGRLEGGAGETRAPAASADGGPAASERAVHEFVEELRRRHPGGDDASG
jgi:hypothetical protein